MAEALQPWLQETWRAAATDLRLLHPNPLRLFVYRAYGELVASENYSQRGAAVVDRKDYGLILEAAKRGVVPMRWSLDSPAADGNGGKGRDDADWAGFAREVTESAGL